MSRLFTRFAALVLAAALLVGAPTAALAKPKPLKGPIPAFVEKVVDGDTLVVRARIWLGQELRIKVRLNGIDTPEMRSRCPEEKQMARTAKSFVQKLVGQRRIQLKNVREGKYAGRVIADVALRNGDELAARLLQAKLARPYKKGRRLGWCGVARKTAPRYDKQGLVRHIKESSAKAIDTLKKRFRGDLN